NGSKVQVPPTAVHPFRPFELLVLLLTSGQSADVADSAHQSGCAKRVHNDFFDATLTGRHGIGNTQTLEPRRPCDREVACLVLRLVVERRHSIDRTMP